MPLRKLSKAERMHIETFFVPIYMLINSRYIEFLVNLRPTQRINAPKGFQLMNFGVPSH
jgi:hypothetical protein